MAAPAKKGMGLLALMGGGEDEDASDPMAEKTAAAREFIGAVKRGDAEGVAHAFQDMYDICAGAVSENDDLGGLEEEDEDALGEE